MSLAMIPSRLRTVLWKLERQRRRDGVLGAARVAIVSLYYRLRYLPQIRRDQAITRAREQAAVRFDQLHGTDTAENVQLASLKLAGDSWVHSRNYQGTDENDFVTMLAALQIRFQEFVLVDIGSGKGKALLLASRYPFKRIVGVEFAAALHEIARKNIEIYRDSEQVCFDIESICMDATQYELPHDPTVLMLFNPFEEPIMRRFVANLEESLRAAPRPLYLLYLNPRQAHVVDESRLLRLTRDEGWYRRYEAIQ
jgi:hypothetical protein